MQIYENIKDFLYILSPEEAVPSLDFFFFLETTVLEFAVLQIRYMCR